MSSFFTLLLPPPSLRKHMNSSIDISPPRTELSMNQTTIEPRIASTKWDTTRRSRIVERLLIAKTTKSKPIMIACKELADEFKTDERSVYSTYRRILDNYHIVKAGKRIQPPTPLMKEDYDIYSRTLVKLGLEQSPASDQDTEEEEEVPENDVVETSSPRKRQRVEFVDQKEDKFAVLDTSVLLTMYQQLYLCTNVAERALAEKILRIIAKKEHTV